MDIKRIIPTFLALAAAPSACNATPDTAVSPNGADDSPDRPSVAASNRESGTEPAADAASDAPSAAEVPPPAQPTRAAKPSRPSGVAEDWQPVPSAHGLSFWVPPAWTVDKPGSAALVTHQGGMEFAVPVCEILHRPEFAGSPAKLESLALAAAKPSAKRGKVGVNRNAAKDEVSLEYKASGDGTVVLERWIATPTAGIGLTCIDEHGGEVAGTRDLLDAILRSLQRDGS